MQDASLTLPAHESKRAERPEVNAKHVGLLSAETTKTYQYVFAYLSR